ncbi:hypothetical protein, partial [Caenispirillum bisanense]|uniref:hypothetical protein n=1 Tax=Caenispirillum bisanense TaxID=414052 RepID=UPI0031D4C89A
AADRLAAFLAATGASGIAAADAVTGRWLGAQAAALPTGCRLWTPAAAALAGLADRTQQVEAARAVGLDVPPTYVVRAALAGSVPKGQFPVVARPLDATTAAATARRFARRGDLAAQLRKAGALAPPLVVQPHRPGALLLVRGCRGHDGGVFALDAFLAERTLHGRPVSLRPAPLPPRLAARCAAFADAGGLTGPFELAFTVAAGRLWFDEAAYGFGRAGRLAMRLGYDLPRHLLVAHGAAPRPPTPDSVAAACAVDRSTLLRHGRALLADSLPAVDRRSDDSRWRLLASDLGDLIGGRGA